MAERTGAGGGVQDPVSVRFVGRTAGDEARFFGVRGTPHKEASPSRPAMPNLPPACWIEWFEPLFLFKKKKTSH